MNDEPRPRRWFPVALCAGLTYFAIGRAFTLPQTNVVAWRRAAWACSAVVFAMHILFEHYTLRSAPRTTALHAAVGSAIGALALAVGGVVHALTTNVPLRPIWIFAVFALPIGTGILAFLVAFSVATLFVRRASATTAHSRP